MTKEAMLGYMNAQPFKPFLVILPNGEQYEVLGREWASLSPNGRLLNIFTHGGDGQRVIDIQLVPQVVFEPMAAK